MDAKSIFNVCINYPLLNNKLSQIQWLNTTKIDYPTVSVGWDSVAAWLGGAGSGSPEVGSGCRLRLSEGTAKLQDPLPSWMSHGSLSSRPLRGELDLPTHAMAFARTSHSEQRGSQCYNRHFPLACWKPFTRFSPQSRGGRVSSAS